MNPPLSKRMRSSSFMTASSVRRPSSLRQELMAASCTTTATNDDDDDHRQEDQEDDVDTLMESTSSMEEVVNDELFKSQRNQWGKPAESARTKTTTTTTTRTRTIIPVPHPLPLPRTHYPRLKTLDPARFRKHLATKVFVKSKPSNEGRSCRKPLPPQPCCFDLVSTYGLTRGLWFDLWLDLWFDLRLDCCCTPPLITPHQPSTPAHHSDGITNMQQLRQRLIIESVGMTTSRQQQLRHHMNHMMADREMRRSASPTFDRDSDRDRGRDQPSTSPVPADSPEHGRVSPKRSRSPSPPPKHAPDDDDGTTTTTTTNSTTSSSMSLTRANQLTPPRNQTGVRSAADSSPRPMKHASSPTTSTAAVHTWKHAAVHGSLSSGTSATTAACVSSSSSLSSSLSSSSEPSTSVPATSVVVSGIVPYSRKVGVVTAACAPSFKISSCNMDAISTATGIDTQLQQQQQQLQHQQLQLQQLQPPGAPPPSLPASPYFTHPARRSLPVARRLFGHSGPLVPQPSGGYYSIPLSSGGERQQQPLAGGEDSSTGGDEAKEAMMTGGAGEEEENEEEQPPSKEAMMTDAVSVLATATASAPATTTKPALGDYDATTVHQDFDRLLRLSPSL